MLFLKKIKCLYLVVLIFAATILTAEVKFTPDLDTFDYNEVIKKENATKGDLYTSFIIDIIPSIQPASGLMWCPGTTDGVKQQDDKNNAFIVSRHSLDIKSIGTYSCVFYSLKAKFKDNEVNISFENIMVSYKETPMSFTMSTATLEDYIQSLNSKKKREKVLKEINESLNKVLKNLKKKL